jgi:hypothetical protein
VIARLAAPADAPMTDRDRAAQLARKLEPARSGGQVGGALLEVRDGLRRLRAAARNEARRPAGAA